LASRVVARAKRDDREGARDDDAGEQDERDERVAALGSSLSRRELARVVELRDQIVALGKQLGFAYVALDLAGFRSGSLNEVLPAEALIKLRPGRAS
jgi:hypothetical protein